MCNHYEKNVEALNMALSIVEKPGWVLNDDGDVVVPDDLAALPPDTYPKSQAPVVLRTAEGCSIATLRWGVRVEVKGATKPVTKFVTNARDDKLSGFVWRYALANRRCLIPARSYFEPDGPDGAKWEVRYTLKDRPAFFFAGIWDADPDGTRSFAMVTTSPNDLAAKIHDRMPLVLSDAGARQWLGHKPLDAGVLRTLVVPYPADAMTSVALVAPDRKISKKDLTSQGELSLGF